MHKCNNSCINASSKRHYFLYTTTTLPRMRPVKVRSAIPLKLDFNPIKTLPLYKPIDPSFKSDCYRYNHHPWEKWIQRRRRRRRRTKVRKRRILRFSHHPHHYYHYHPYMYYGGSDIEKSHPSYYPLRWPILLVAMIPLQNPGWRRRRPRRRRILPSIRTLPIHHCPF